MNVVRFMAVSAMVCLFGAGVQAEEKTGNAKLLIGKWEVTKGDQGTIPVGSSVEFTKDGKIKLALKMGEQEVAFEGTYTVEKDTFTMVVKVGDMEHKTEVTIKKISDMTMSTIDKDGRGVELMRKK